MKIVRATLRDIEDMMKLYNKLNEVHMRHGVNVITNSKDYFDMDESASDEDVCKEYVNCDCMSTFLLKANGKTHGLLSICVVEHYKCCFIVNLVVDEEKQGYGSELMKYATKLTTGEGYNALQLHVYKFNKEAIEFYKKLDYVVIEDHAESYVMEKMIKE